ncbi:trichohyalin-like [Zophobas morio]|uniref:trichohyalin-like n=1 Tax=Zophobas morio TaxID=2755281 RepID=UPI003082B659
MESTSCVKCSSENPLQKPCCLCGTVVCFPCVMKKIVEWKSGSLKNIPNWWCESCSQENKENVAPNVPAEPRKPGKCKKCGHHQPVAMQCIRCNAAAFYFCTADDCWEFETFTEYGGPRWFCSRCLPFGKYHSRNKGTKYVVPILGAARIKHAEWLELQRTKYFMRTEYSFQDLKFPSLDAASDDDSSSSGTDSWEALDDTLEMINLSGNKILATPMDELTELATDVRNYYAAEATPHEIAQRNLFSLEQVGEIIAKIKKDKLPQAAKALTRIPKIQSPMARTPKKETPEKRKKDHNAASPEEVELSLIKTPEKQREEKTEPSSVLKENHSQNSPKPKKTTPEKRKSDQYPFWVKTLVKDTTESEYGTLEEKKEAKNPQAAKKTTPNSTLKEDQAQTYANSKRNTPEKRKRDDIDLWMLKQLEKIDSKNDISKKKNESKIARPVKNAQPVSTLKENQVQKDAKPKKQTPEKRKMDEKSLLMEQLQQNETLLVLQGVPPAKINEVKKKLSTPKKDQVQTSPKPREESPKMTKQEECLRWVIKRNEEEHARWVRKQKDMKSLHETPKEKKESENAFSVKMSEPLLTLNKDPVQESAKPKEETPKKIDENEGTLYTLWMIEQIENAQKSLFRDKKFAENILSMKPTESISVPKKDQLLQSPKPKEETPEEKNEAKNALSVKTTESIVVPKKVQGQECAIPRKQTQKRKREEDSALTHEQQDMLLVLQNAPFGKLIEGSKSSSVPKKDQLPESTKLKEETSEKKKDEHALRLKKQIQEAMMESIYETREVKKEATNLLPKQDQVQESAEPKEETFEKKKEDEHALRLKKQIQEAMMESIYETREVKKEATNLLPKQDQVQESAKLKEETFEKKKEDEHALRLKKQIQEAMMESIYETREVKKEATNLLPKQDQVQESAKPKEETFEKKKEDEHALRLKKQIQEAMMESIYETPEVKKEMKNEPSTKKTESVLVRRVQEDEKSNKEASEKGKKEEGTLLVKKQIEESAKWDEVKLEERKQKTTPISIKVVEQFLTKVRQDLFLENAPTVKKETPEKKKQETFPMILQKVEQFLTSMRNFQVPENPLHQLLERQMANHNAATDNDEEKSPECREGQNEVPQERRELLDQLLDRYRYSYFRKWLRQDPTEEKEETKSEVQKNDEKNMGENSKADKEGTKVEAVQQETGNEDGETADKINEANEIIPVEKNPLEDADEKLKILKETLVEVEARKDEIRRELDKMLGLKQLVATYISELNTNLAVEVAKSEEPLEFVAKYSKTAEGENLAFFPKPLLEIGEPLTNYKLQTEEEHKRDERILLRNFEETRLTVEEAEKRMAHTTMEEARVRGDIEEYQRLKNFWEDLCKEK